MLTLEEFREKAINSDFKNVIVNPFNKGQTKTTQLFMPILGFSSETMPKNFINAYINDFKKDFKFDVLILMFSIPDSNEYLKQGKWLNFHENYISKENYIGFYSNGFIDGKNTICFVYEIPKRFLKELDLFFKGKYSHYSVEAKNKFTKFYNKGGILVESLTNQILYKKPELKKSWEKLLSELDDYPLTDVSLEDSDELWQRPYVREEKLNNKTT